MKKNHTISLLFYLLLILKANSQTTWSVTTDFSAIRNFKSQQQFWSVGHTIRGELHLTKRDGPYAWVSYFIPGKFNNNLVAEAKSSTTTPQTIAYRNKANINVKQISIGWKHYFKGKCDNERSWNFYGMAGFGVVGGKVKNDFLTAIDTSLYHTPILNGESRFKRLTIDLGAGWEAPVTGDLMFYNELKVWIPSSDYPSKYLLNNGYVPLIASFHLGIRFYFD